MDKTANYGLNKPAGSDYADVDVLNENMDAIDLEMKNQEDFAKEHAESKKNPHGVTKEQVGLGNVPNVATNDQTPTYTEAGAISKLASGEKLSAAFSKIAKAITDLISHIANKSNPHVVTAAQVGADVSGAAAAVQENLNAHTGNSGIHVTAEEKAAWNGKENAGAAAAVQQNLNSHAGNSGIHVTDAEKKAWYGKAPGVHYHDERYFTEDEVNSLLATKAALSHGHAQSDIAGLVAALASGAKIATGSYVGTGTYGASNPCSLTFDFVPKLLIVGIPVTVAINGEGVFKQSFIWTEGNTRLTTRTEGGAVDLYIATSGKTISWYATYPDPMAQINSNGITYTYFALG